LAPEYDQTAKEVEMASVGKVVWVGRVLSALVGLLLIASAIGKLVGGPQLDEGFKHVQLDDSMVRPLAVLEMSCGVVYLIPQVAVLGAILVSGYMGGAILTHWRVGDPFFVQIMIGVAAWLGVYLRESRLRALLPIRRP
jgi:hypothetical protein